MNPLPPFSSPNQIQGHTQNRLHFSGDRRDRFSQSVKSPFRKVKEKRIRHQMSTPDLVQRIHNKDINPDKLKTERPNRRKFEKINADLQKQILEGLETLNQDPEWMPDTLERVKASTNSLLQDANTLEENGQHNHAYDVLVATAGKLNRALTQPLIHGLIQEKIGSPVPNYFSVVSGKVFRGGQPTKAGIEWLAKQNIKTIINLRDPDAEEQTNYPNWTLSDEKATAEKLGMQYIALPQVDQSIPNEETVKKFLTILRNNQNQPIYIHCAAGVGRTGILSALAMKEHGMSSKHIQAQSLKGGLRPDLWRDHYEQFEYIKAL